MIINGKKARVVKTVLGADLKILAQHSPGKHFVGFSVKVA
jgi:hypothetical protein